MECWEDAGASRQVCVGGSDQWCKFTLFSHLEIYAINLGLKKSSSSASSSTHRFSLHVPVM